MGIDILARSGFLVKVVDESGCDDESVVSEMGVEPVDPLTIIHRADRKLPREHTNYLLHNTKTIKFYIDVLAYDLYTPHSHISLL